MFCFSIAHRGRFPSCVIAVWIGLSSLPLVACQNQLATTESRVDPESQTYRLIIKAKNEVTLSAPGNSTIKHSKIRPGTLLKNNEVVFELDSKELTLEVEKLEYEMKKSRVKAKDDSIIKGAEASLRSASFELDQLNALQQSDSGVRIAPLELERARNSFAEAKSNLNSAISESKQAEADFEARKADRDIALIKKKDFRVTSPFSGQVIQVFREAGDYVEQGQPVATVFRMDVVEGVVNLNALDIGPESAVGKRLQVDWGDSLATADFETDCLIVRIIPKIESDGRYRAICEITNRQSSTGSWLLVPGMTFTANSPSSESTNESATQQSNPVETGQ